MRSSLSATIVLALALAACGGTPGPAAPGTGANAGGDDVSAEDVAERLMDALVDEDYEQAHADLSTGQARDFADDPAGLQARIEDMGGPVTAYDLEAPRIEDDDGNSISVIEGNATMADGSEWSVLIRMQALGLQADPWRINEFDLQPDG